jgi:hypothetical protein
MPPSPYGADPDPPLPEQLVPGNLNLAGKDLNPLGRRLKSGPLSTYTLNMKEHEAFETLGELS